MKLTEVLQNLTNFSMDFAEGNKVGITINQKTNHMSLGQ